MNQKLLISVAAFLGLYLFTTGTSFAVFSYVVSPNSLTFISPGDANADETNDQPREESKLRLLLDNSGPKTESCPINGKKYTVVEKDAWEARRPLLVMIENHEDARPQSGLSSADVVYEAVAEGGITRFMGIFYCDAQQAEITVGPVRSARTYFMDWASEYSDFPLYAHVGGANCNHGCPPGKTQADALGQLEKYGWVAFKNGLAVGNDLSQFSIGFPTFARDYDRLYKDDGSQVDTEHTMYSSTEKLWDVAKQRGWTNVGDSGDAWDSEFVPWKFVEAGEVEKGDTAQISYNFWESSPAGDFSVRWDYNANDNIYRRFMAGEAHMDLNVEEQIMVKNVVVLFQKESNADNGYPGNVHLLYGTTGTGDGVLFQNGNVEEITWEKEERTDRTLMYDSKGKEVNFVEGKIWISIVPTYNVDQLSY